MIRLCFGNSYNAWKKVQSPWGRDAGSSTKDVESIPLGEGYDGDIAFASSLEAFGGGHSDPLFVALGGESYAGKYVPAIGYYILKKNSELEVSEIVINLAGLTIGDGLTDPKKNASDYSCFECLLCWVNQWKAKGWVGETSIGSNYLNPKGEIGVLQHMQDM